LSFLAQPGPRWFSIPAHRPFLADLATGLMQALAGQGPEQLAQATLLVPSRRAARALAEAFLGVTGARATLLPQIRAIGDLEEDEPPFEPGELGVELPPAVSPLRRRFELARIVAEQSDRLGRSFTAAGALELADALGGFLESLEIEEVEVGDRLAGLVEGELARHWQLSAGFLQAALAAWRARLRELGLTDVSTRRVELLRRLGAQWALKPPAGVLVAAGSTGTTPAAAAVLKAVAEAPQGAVVLPGLDLDLAEEAWAEVGEQHPQSAMKRLLDGAGMARGEVRVWPASLERGAHEGRWQRRVINEALRPPESTKDWAEQIRSLRAEAPGEDPVAAGLEGLSVIAARTEDEAAGVAALLMREALETPEKTCALVTPDQALARRVSARLARWGVEVDTSAGSPLTGRPVGVLARLAARMGADPADPVRLLAILKHPFVRLGLEPDALRRARRDLEEHGLRGPRPEGWAALADRLRKKAEPRDDGQAPPEAFVARLAAAAALAERLRAALALAADPFTGGTATPGEVARGLVLTMEALAADADGATGGLWAGADGEAATQLLSALINESEGLPEATPSGFAELVEALLEGAVVRSTGAAHSRLKILGALEARLISADRLILAGLEEGVWPRAAAADPFLSRPMRAALGLPPPERRIGLSAHDFAQAASSPEVILLHSERREGAPAVESRWLWRLKTLARGAGLPLPSRPEALAWARALDAPETFRPALRPKPTPPVEVRPDRLSVTRVERWVRDPYATYAEAILRLRPMELPDEPIEARARGTALHKALERFALRFPDTLPDDAAQVLAQLMTQALREDGMPEAGMARETAIAARAALEMLEFERERRRPGMRLVIEQRGELKLSTDAGEFTVSAKSDRIELDGGTAHILDYKTGGAPTKKQVQSGLAPQLTLTAAILQGGGFPGVEPHPPGELMYVKLGAGREPVRQICVADQPDSEALARAALDGLIRRARHFAARSTPYVAKAAPQFMGDRGDYDHLARVWEWLVIGAGEEGGE
jgi:ATP-dependent helicase/nuclease subunit B